MKQIFIITIISLVLLGCNATGQNIYGGTYQDDFYALKQVDAGDGINQSEAYIIAKAFFWSNISGCGFPSEPALEKNYWVSMTQIGYAGTPGVPIFIHKDTGTITWGDKSKIVTLEELKKTESNNAHAL